MTIILLVTVLAGYWMLGINRGDIEEEWRKEYGGIMSLETGLDYPPVHGWQHSDVTAKYDSKHWEEDQKLTFAGKGSF